MAVCTMILLSLPKYKFVTNIKPQRSSLSKSQLKSSLSILGLLPRIQILGLLSGLLFGGFP